MNTAREASSGYIAQVFIGFANEMTGGHLHLSDEEWKRVYEREMEWNVKLVEQDEDQDCVVAHLAKAQEAAWKARIDFPYLLDRLSKLCSFKTGENDTKLDNIIQEFHARAAKGVLG
jgi:hypothetical protein